MNIASIIEEGEWRIHDDKEHEGSAGEPSPQLRVIPKQNAPQISINIPMQSRRNEKHGEKGKMLCGLIWQGWMITYELRVGK